MRFHTIFENPKVGLESLTIETFQAMGGKSPKSLTPVKTAGGGVKPPPVLAAKTGPATGPAVVTPPISSAGQGLDEHLSCVDSPYFFPQLIDVELLSRPMLDYSS